MMWLMLLGLVGAGLMAGELGGSGDPASEPEGENQTGNDSDDVLTGTDRPDLIFGDGGNDTISGGGATDLLLGGTGNDLLAGEQGDDILLGGADNDTLLGGPGDDLLFDGAGNDQMQGGAGEDTLFAFSGQDTLDGGQGDDLLIGLDLPDNAEAGLDGSFASLEAALQSAMDQVFGAAPQVSAGVVVSEAFATGTAVPGQTGDLLSGGQGEDTLVGDSGDTMAGGTGRDDFYIAAARADHAYTAEGFEPVRIVDYEAGETVWLAYDQTAAGPVPVLSQHAVGGATELRLDGRTVAVVENPGGAVDARVVSNASVIAAAL